MKQKLFRLLKWPKNPLAWCFLLSTAATVAQQPLTLEQCYSLAEKNYPLYVQVELLSNSNQLKIRNLNKNYLPQINVNGGVSVQSDVTQVAIELPKGLPELTMPTLSKDWYKITLDVNQSIYDGNVTRYQKQVEDFNLRADQKGVEIELYKLKDRINQIFFGILLLDQQDALLKSNKEKIQSKLKEAAAAFNNGVMLEMNVDLFRAELVRIDQQLTEIMMDRTTSYQMLSELTSTAIPESTVLEIPTIALPSFAYENKRLEFQLFDIQRAKVEVQKNMVTTKWNPRIFAYGQAGYGRPGLNMLDDTFRPWWLLGAKITWNPWNWSGNKNEKKILGLQNEILKSQQETFDKNLKISSQKEFSEVAKVSRLLEQDQQIIDIRAKITKTTASQLTNGVITSSDYIARLNEETLARLNLEIHKLQLIKAKLAYLYTLGKL